MFTIAINFLPFCPSPLVLWTDCLRSIRISNIEQKLYKCITLLRKLAGSRGAAGAKTLCTAAISLVHLTCAAVWCHSAHTCFTDSVLYDALCIATGCLCLTLPILSGILPAELCRQEVTLSLAKGPRPYYKYLKSLKMSDPLSTLLINLHDSLFYHTQHPCYYCNLIPNHFALVQN